MKGNYEETHLRGGARCVRCRCLVALADLQRHDAWHRDLGDALMRMAADQSADERERAGLEERLKAVVLEALHERDNEAENVELTAAKQEIHRLYRELQTRQLADHLGGIVDFNKS